MVSTSRSLQVALLSVLLGLVGLATVAYRISVYESPDDGGTSLAGLAFFVFLLVCVATAAEAGFVAALVRWADPSVWPRRILAVGAAGAGLAALSLTLSLVPAIAGDTSVLGRVLIPVARPLGRATWLFAFVGLAGTFCGSVAEVVPGIRQN